MSLYIEQMTGLPAAMAKLGFAQLALSEKIKLTTAALWAQAKAWLATPAGAITAIVGGIVVAVAITDEFTTSLKEHQEELSNLKQEYSDLSQKLDKLNKQYSDNTEKISELNKLKKEGSITATQDNELSSLKETNAQLALQIELQEKLKESKSKDSSKEFVETAKSLLDDHNYSSENTHISESGIILHNQISGIEKTEEEVAKYKKAQDKLIALRDSGIDVTSKKFAKQKKKIENEANEATDFLSKYLEEINNTLSNQDYFKDPTDQWQKDTNEMYDRLSTARAKIMLLLNKGDPNGTVFNSILNSAKYEKAAKSLSNLGKAGDLTGSKIKQMAKSDSNLKDLIDELKELGLFDGENFDELANQFNKVESGADNAAQSVKTFKDVIDGISDSSGKIDSLSKAFEDFSKNGTLSWDSIKGIGEGFSDVQGIQDYVNTLAQAGLTSGQFNDVASTLASSLLSQDAATGKLNGSTADLYVKMLESCGIENALAIITAILSGANYGADSSARTAATGIGAMGTAAGNSAIGVKGAKDALVGFSGVSINTSGIGSRLGQWTNGTPPYPYEYERWKEKYNPKGLVVNDDKLPIYRYMVDSYLTKAMSTSQIAYELNKQGIPSPRGKNWTNVTIARLLADETHLGNIISNKTAGDGHKKKKPSSKKLTKIPRDQWVIVNNCHEPVKSSEEHAQILLKLNASHKYFPRVPIKKTHALTGLIKCGVCGHTMQITDREDRKTQEVIKSCWYKNELGEKCCNHGGGTDIVYVAIKKSLNRRIEQLRIDIESLDNSSSIDTLANEIKIAKKQLADKESVINFIYDQYEQGIYDRKRFDERRAKAEKEISAIKDRLDILQAQINNINNENKKDRYDTLIRFSNLLASTELSAEESNLIYCSIIKSVTYRRLDLNKKPDIEVEFK